jgi:hypothetical protein
LASVPGVVVVVTAGAGDVVGVGLGVLAALLGAAGVGTAGGGTPRGGAGVVLVAGDGLMVAGGLVVGAMPLLTVRTTVDPDGTLAPAPGELDSTVPAGVAEATVVGENCATRPSALRAELASALDLLTTGGTLT